MVIITDESKLHQAEVKAETSGMLLECEEEDYDSGLNFIITCHFIGCKFAMHIDPDFSDSDDEEKVVGDIKGQVYRMLAHVQS